MSDSKFASLYPRIVTGVCLFAAVFSAWYIGSYAFLGLICLICFSGQMEFCNFFMKDSPKLNKLIAPCFGIFYLFVIFVKSNDASHAIVLLAILFFSLISLVHFCQETSMKNMKNSAIMLFSFLYLPYVFGFSLDMLPEEQILVFLIPIVSDTVAYFAGIYFGKRKIWVSVSPKKSVEGSFAGLVATVILIVFFGLNYNIFHTNSVEFLIAIGIFISIFTQLGDFFESGVKRCVNVKDSGKILPGHGGVLDRIDSLIFTLASFEICKTLFV